MIIPFHELSIIPLEKGYDLSSFTSSSDDLKGPALHPHFMGQNPDQHVILQKLKYAARRIREKCPLKHLR